jgi:hypothetical protein
MLKSPVAILDRRIAPRDKRADPFYLTEAHRQWRALVLARAGGRCEAIENGERCAKAAPHHRMFADHIRELQDGGDPLDPFNGQCLCGAHHTRKTMQARARRMATGQGHRGD